MTNTRKSLPTTCTECGVKLTRANRSGSPFNRAGLTSDHDDVCVDCYEYWGWENTHSDESHGPDNIDPACAVCHKTLTPAPTSDKVVTMNENTNSRKWNSHANCAHAKTPKDRAACRAAGGPKAAAPAPKYSVGASVHIGKSSMVWEVVMVAGANMIITSPRGARKTVAIDDPKIYPAVI